MVVVGDVSALHPCGITWLSLNNTINEGSVRLQLLGDTSQTQAKLLKHEIGNIGVLPVASKLLVVQSVTVQSNINTTVATGGPVNAQTLRQRKTEVASEVAAGRLELNALGDFRVGGCQDTVWSEDRFLQVRSSIRGVERFISFPQVRIYAGRTLGGCEVFGSKPVAGVTAELVAKGETTTLMVSGGNQDGLRVAVVVDPFSHSVHGTVKLEDFMEMASWVVGMACVVLGVY